MNGGAQGSVRSGGRQAVWTALAAVAVFATTAAQPASPDTPAAPALRVVGDAIPLPLSDSPGDPSRGRAIVVDRQRGLCLLCHSGPFPQERFQGNLAPSLAGAGTRWSTGQLRLRVADSRRLAPQSLMPSFHGVQGLVRVAPAWRDRPLLDAQQIEDVVAFLATLRE
ncbi:MAG: sulfur oxidation c-type cytochrome SoxX [Burkholderiaceae bacterium]|nr:sulfur oxidation c-type cytochrome SoxX [Burkholderiaceae bacterium]